MTQWYVKDLSRITRVSVQTLHHYDRIGLLKPSVRLANGYRLYSEPDLLKLQQIVALKYFGFELAKIKTLLVDETETVNHLKAQAEHLAKKAGALLEDTCGDSKALRDEIYAMSEQDDRVSPAAKQ